MEKWQTREKQNRISETQIFFTFSASNQKEVDIKYFWCKHDCFPRNFMDDKFFEMNEWMNVLHKIIDTEEGRLSDHRYLLSESVDNSMRLLI